MSSSDSTAVPPGRPRPPLVPPEARPQFLGGAPGRRRRGARPAPRGAPAAISRYGPAHPAPAGRRRPGPRARPRGRAQRLRPGSAFLAQALAILTARARGWAAAAPLFAAPAATRTPGAAASLLRGRPAPAAALALPARARPPVSIPRRRYARRLHHRLRDEPDPAPVFAGLPGLRFALPHRPAPRRGGLGDADAGPRAPPTAVIQRGPPPGAASAPISHWPRRRPRPCLALPAPRPLAGGQPQHAPAALVPRPRPGALAASARDRLAGPGRARAGHGARRRPSSPRPRPAQRAACRATAAPGIPGMIWRRHHARRSRRSWRLGGRRPRPPPTASRRRRSMPR